MSKKKKRYMDVQDDDSFSRGKAKKEDRYKRNVIVNAMTEGQKDYIIEIKNNDITFCFGPAGSGKTAVAVGLALQYLCAPTPAYEKFVILRPAKEACDEKIGYLPGDVGAKLEGYVAPVMDNMEVFIDRSQIKNLFYQNKIEVVPLAFIRGRSFNKSIILVDEAQNCSPQQMLAILTRLGKASKMIIAGDPLQSDVRNSGLQDAVEKLQDIPGIGLCELDATDIVRHPLIGKILERYSDNHQA